jgi:RNA polymerase sigma factor (sigma-70 family)
VAITARLKQRKRDRREFTHEPPPDIPQGGTTAEQHLVTQERRQMLFAAVRELGFADRQITVLYLEGFSGAEIEAVTGIAEGAVATRLTRIREKLRRAVEAKGAGNGR